MPEAFAAIGKIAFWSIFGIGCWTAATSAFLYFRDRSGNSGRSNHWAENPRIKSPRAERIDGMMDVIEALHGDTLRALAESDRQDRMAAEASKLSDEDHAAYGAMIHAMRPRDDRRDDNAL